MANELVIFGITILRSSALPALTIPVFSVAPKYRNRNHPPSTIDFNNRSYIRCHYGYDYRLNIIYTIIPHKHLTSRISECIFVNASQRLETSDNQIIYYSLYGLARHRKCPGFPLRGWRWECKIGKNLVNNYQQIYQLECNYSG